MSMYWPRTLLVVIRCFIDIFDGDFERSKLLNSVDFRRYHKMANAIHNGNDADTFSDDSDVILNVFCHLKNK